MKTKRILCSILLSLAVPCALLAQTSMQSDETGWGNLRLGPKFSGGAAVNAGDVSQGTKTSPLFSYTAAAQLDIPFARSSALDVELGLDSRAINFHDQSLSNVGIDYAYRYLAMRPTLHFSGLLFGVGVGLPLGAVTTAHGGAIAPTIRTSDMNVLFEGRIGGQVPVWESKTGTLYFMLEGSYAFNRVLADSYFIGGDRTKDNGPLASSQVGFVYLFNAMQKNAEPVFAATK